MVLEERCQHYYLRLVNHRLYQNASSLPQMFVSGELHGNERLGPTAALEFAIFLLQNRAHFDSTYRTDVRPLFDL